MPTSGLSGNEMYCLDLKGLTAGDLVVGNSVFSLGFVGGLGAGLKALIGGELTAITNIVREGRQNSYDRLVAEAQKHGAIGITSVSSDLIRHPGNVEFLSIGSAVHKKNETPFKNFFSSSADGQELFCQLDAGFHPHKFVFGNVAYAIGVGGGLLASLRSLARGEVKEYSDVLNKTRHLALERIKAEATECGANAVVGIQTTIQPVAGAQEMLMIGTASNHPELSGREGNPVTSDLTNVEMWSLRKLGYMPIELLLGVSVYSLGVVGGITSVLKGFVRGEISELTHLIYDARENALAKISDDAKACGADEVVGVKTYVYDMGGGLIEFMAIGTAVKKMAAAFPCASENLPVQAVVKDKDTFTKVSDLAVMASLNDELKGSLMS